MERSPRGCVHARACMRQHSARPRVSTPSARRAPQRAGGRAREARPAAGRLRRMGSHARGGHLPSLPISLIKKLSPSPLSHDSDESAKLHAAREQLPAPHSSPRRPSRRAGGRAELCRRSTPTRRSSTRARRRRGRPAGPPWSGRPSGCLTRCAFDQPRGARLTSDRARPAKRPARTNRV